MAFKYQNTSAFLDVVNTSSERLLLMMLAAFANQDGECYPSIETLKQLTRLSPRNIIGTLKELENKGLLTRTKRFSSSTVYKLNIKSEDAKCATPELHNLQVQNYVFCRGDVQNVQSNRSLNRSDLTDNKPPYISPQGETPDQEENGKQENTALQEDKPKKALKKPGIDYEEIRLYWNSQAEQRGVATMMVMNDSRIRAVNRALRYKTMTDKTTRGVKRLIYAFFKYAKESWFKEDMIDYVTLEVITKDKHIETWLKPLKEELAAREAQS